LQKNHHKRKQIIFFIPKIVIPFCLFVLVIFLMAGSALSSESRYKITRRDLIFGLSFSGPDIGIAVGSKGLILRTMNRGGDWAKIESKTFYAFNDVTLRDTKGWIVGQGGTILFSADSGKTWKPQKTNTNLSLMQILFLDEKKGITIGEMGTVLATDDGGNAWIPIEIDWFSILPESLLEMGVIAPNLYDITFASDRNGFMVGDYGIVLATDNGGQTWTLLRAGNLPPIFSVSFVDRREGWAAGQNGLLLHTTDGGLNWKQIDIPTNASLYKIYLSGEHGFIVGNQATILQTCNSGKAWTKVDLKIPPPYPWFGDIAVAANSCPVELVLGGSGLISKVSISVNLED